MGFFDKIKSAKNYLTGGGAKVYVEVTDPSFEEPFNVHIRAVISDSDLKINRVYLKVRAVEDVTIPNVEVTEIEVDDQEVNSERRDISRSTETFQREFNVSGSETLSAGQEYEWDTEVELPDNASGSYYGYNAKHRWLFQAGLDAAGNDPDSGWIEVEIY